MATTLGGISLPDPVWDYEGYETAVKDIGTLHEMLDGDLVLDHTGYRRAFALRWVGIDSTDKTTIWNRYVVKTVQAFSPPDDAGTINVLVVPGSWREAYIESDGSAIYRVAITLEEQAAN